MRYTFLSLVQEDKILFRLARGIEWLKAEITVDVGEEGGVTNIKLSLVKVDEYVLFDKTVLSSVW